MKTYKVHVIRISYSGKWIEVQAENEADAETIAKETAVELVFDNEYSADYDLNDLFPTEEITNPN